MVAIGSRQALVWLLVASAVPCHTFAVPETFRSLHQQQGRKIGYVPTTKTPIHFRGGDSSTLEASLADYSGAAAGLFGNVVGPAALLAGGLVPLGFLAPPPPGDDAKGKRIRSLYHLLSVFSLANELSAIVYATVASNKLTETVAAPAKSVFALLQRDYELSWVAVNVHFLLGLFGFMSMIGLRAFTIFPSNLKGPATGLAVSALFGMLSIVNRGVAEGNRDGQVFAGSSVSLCLRYVQLMVRTIRNSGGIMALMALGLSTVSIIYALKAVWEAEK